MMFKKDELEIIKKEDIDLRDLSNPRSVINLVPSSVANGMRAIPLEVFTMPEEELKLAAHADITENRLRHSFWLEYGHALLGDRKMNMAQVYNGVCRREYWNQQIITNSFKLAYILTPPPDYKVQMAELLTLGLAQLRDILTMPLATEHPKTGEMVVDARLAAVKARIVEDLMTRSHGHPLRQIEVTSKNMNLNVEVASEAQAETRDVAELDAKIKQLEGELSKQKALDVQGKRVQKLVE
jgi:hypothetical protein